MTFNTLVIDDDPEVRKSLASILESVGYLVKSAENGKEAIRMCETTSFDFALIDIELPDIKGTELLRMLKQKQPKMIKIIITGHPSIENAARSLNEQADGYLMKPFNVPELLEMMSRFID